MREQNDVITLPGAPEVSVQVRRSARARRLALKVSRLDGSVVLTLPKGASMRLAQGFVTERQDWLREALRGVEGPVAVELGAQIPFEGVLRRITAADLRHAQLDGEALLVPAARAAASVQAFMTLSARDRLAARVAVHTQALGRRAGKLTLRDTRSRWGSCTPAGDLMFSWRLVMTPPAILDYVAAHEVAHLAQMNHSPAFWAVVARLYPDYAEARGWLKTHGAALHRYRFDAT
ncbi:M48 family metallopeptidase [Pararhodobacter oceanensis]|uniref:M48 family peptidase n=1 Tax=Pararhodobacter oceanensis TaxID=2172121 RepID=A0A2T8HRT6_9RHOB|nr:SprT family zinc-dependent metalloprotease [Pararhodobacter oceanensis]PVH28125.1 M48 family peptidase [Pararhodobacter oceanensis]